MQTRYFGSFDAAVAAEALKKVPFCQLEIVLILQKYKKRAKDAPQFRQRNQMCDAYIGSNRLPLQSLQGKQTIHNAKAAVHTTNQRCLKC